MACTRLSAFRCCRVTIVRDKVTRDSKGVAFLLFAKREDAHKAVRAMNRKEVRI